MRSPSPAVTAEERAEINDIKRLIRLLAWCGEKVSEGTIEAFPLNEEQRAVLAVQRLFGNTDDQ